MATFALVHGSQHGAWCWDRLAAELRVRGHHVVAPDLPCDDPTAGIDRYASIVVDALADVDDDVIVVGHSLGSLTVPVVASRRPVTHMVFLCSVPTGPGPAIEASLDSMVTPGFRDARRIVDDAGRESLDPDDAITVWFHDCDPADAAWAVAQLRPQSRRPLSEPSPIDTWPDVPTSVVLGRDDQCVNMTWAIEAATARTGRAPTLVDGGHSPFLVRPAELADVLLDVTGTR